MLAFKIVIDSLIVERGRIIAQKIKTIEIPTAE
jgi:hypothetical protein